jgi:hypothetical protein
MKAFGREIRKVLRVRRDWLREQRKEVNKRRFLIVKNDKNLSDKERAELEDILQKHPQFLQYVTPERREVCYKIGERRGDKEAGRNRGE